MSGRVDTLSESDDQKLTIDNSAWTGSGNFTITRSTLQVQGTSTVSIGGSLTGTSAWNNLILQDSASLTVTGGVDFKTVASNLALSGGTLTTSSIWGNDRPSGGNTTNVNFDGTKVVASAANPDFLKVSSIADNGAHTGTANIAAGGLRFDTNAHAVGITNKLGGVGGVTKEGAGTLFVSAVNTYGGGTTVKEGTLSINTDASLGAGGTPLTFSGNSTLQAGAPNVVVASARSVAIDNGVTATFDSNGNSLVINGAISGAGAAGIKKVSAGTLVLGGVNTYTGPTEIAGGTLQLVNPSGGSAPTLLNGTFESPSVGDYSKTLPADWTSGVGVVARLGGGFTWNVPANGSAQGLGLQKTQSLSQDVTFTEPGSYELSWIVNGRNGGEVNPYYFTLDGADVGSANVWDNSGGTWKDASATFFIDSAGTYSLGFRGTETNDRTSFLDNVALDFSSLTGALPSTTAVNISDASGRLDLNGVNQTVASLAGVAGSSVALGSGTLTINPSSGSTDFAGTISGTGGIVKTGAGTLSLAGSNTYFGVTTINSGTLLVNGTHTGGGLYTIASGATIGGSGTFGSSLSVTGVVSPGNSVGTMGAGNTVWNNTGSFVFEIDNATGAAGGPGWDLFDITGSLDLAGLGPNGFTIDVDTLLSGGGTNAGFMDNFVDAGTYDWEFVRTTTGITGFDAGDFIFDLAGFDNPHVGTFSVTSNAFSLFVSYVSPNSAVPEPGTWALFGLLLVGAGVSLRRRRETKH